MYKEIFVEKGKLSYKATFMELSIRNELIKDGLQDKYIIYCFMGGAVYLIDT